MEAFSDKDEIIIEEPLGDLDRTNFSGS